jgi:hypothetical protein
MADTTTHPHTNTNTHTHTYSQCAAVPLLSRVTLSSGPNHVSSRTSSVLSLCVPALRPTTPLSPFSGSSPDARSTALHTLLHLVKGLRKHNNRACEDLITTHAAKILAFCASPNIPPTAVGCVEKIVSECLGGLDGAGEWYRGVLKLLRGGLEGACIAVWALSMLCAEWAYTGAGLGKERESEIGRALGEILLQSESSLCVLIHNMFVCVCVCNIHCVCVCVIFTYTNSHSQSISNMPQLSARPLQTWLTTEALIPVQENQRSQVQTRESRTLLWLP